ncbi:carbonic anhydrase [Cypionkella sp.]|jgi:carbonic anhydrase|uniref:carbonic anhydrase n=1 Tax=Cypionkella sp. TaxID=2811411 RepID=UPI0027558BA9|nr:carbonic anhydrase family protein [Cypionkella sp.]
MFKTLKSLRLGAVLAAFAAPTLAETAHHWTYEGAEGPDHWAEVAEGAGACAAGQEQSPINLAGALPADAPDVTIGWASNTDWSVQNNGHTIQLNPAGDAGKITVDGKDYALLQLHFHHPAEHAIGGMRSPMEAHFVHKAADGALAVIGVMLVGGGQAGWMDKIMAVAPSTPESVVWGMQDPRVLLPPDRNFFRYQGSLTTPPCSEVVLWTVLHQPVAVSDAALAAFAALYEMNARPLQPLNRRFLLTE